MPVATLVPAPPAGRLQRNSIGLLHIIFFAVAAAAPLTAVVGASPVAMAFGNGAGVPGAFVLAGLLYLVFSVGFTAMSRFVGGTGAFYTYITHGLGRPAGVAGAAIAIVTYNAVQVAIYALFGVFVGGALAPVGIELPWWIYAFAALVAVTLCGRRNIAFSGVILGACMAAEVAILLLLDVAILLSGGGPEGVSASAFAPSTVFAPGLGVALVFVIGAFIGFEATAIFAEEVDRPEKTIPRATYGAVLSIGAFYAFSTWAIVQFYGASQIQASAEAGLETLYFRAAEQVLGPWSVEIMNLLLIVSLFACVLSFHNTINRYFFALGRDRIAPSVLRRVHARHGSPAVAGIAQSGLAALILASFVAFGEDPYAVVFSSMSALAVIGILAVQALVCIAVVLFFRRDKRGLGLWTTLIAPVVGLVGLLTVLALVIANLPLLSGSDSAIVASFPVLIVLVGLGGAGFAMWLRASRPARYASLGTAGE